MKRLTACQRNSDLLQKLLDEGNSLSEIAHQVGTNRRCLNEYLNKNNIQHVPYSQAGKNNPKWRGGEVIDKYGYIYVYNPTHPNCTKIGYVRKHRLIMEQHLGRYLLRNEIVHHIDGNINNNSIENLKLYNSNRDHLAETLKGKIPNWTEDGKRRISEGVRLTPRRRRISIQVK